jgi:hypothetical protein
MIASTTTMAEKRGEREETNSKKECHSKYEYLSTGFQILYGRLSDVNQQPADEGHTDSQ